MSWATAVAVFLVLARGASPPCPADAPETRAVVVAESDSDPRSMDRRFLADLQQRRLLQLAETHCRDRLADPELPPRSRAELTAELARTYALWAAESGPEERPSLWQRAHQVADDFQDRAAGDPYAVLVRFRDAAVWLDQGELACREAGSGADPTPLMGQARGELRTALRKLRAIDSELTVARRRRQGEPWAAERAGLTAAELATLQNHVAYQIARALRHQGQCHAAASADRTGALDEAVQWLSPLAELPVADELIWQSRMDRAICFRLLGRIDQADKTLADVVAGGPPPAIARQAQAERIRLLLASEQPREALALATSAGGANGPASADLDIARLEATIASWAAAAREPDGASSARLAHQAAEEVRRIGQQYGAFWLRQAELLFAGAMAGTDLEADVGSFEQAAQSLYRNGNLTEAVAMYDRMGAQAAAEGNAEQAFGAAFTAATIVHDRALRNRKKAVRSAEDSEAMARYSRLARAFPDHPRAAEAHLLAIHHAAAIVRQVATADRLQALAPYVALIEEHVTRWPRMASAVEARWWLGELRETQHRWQEAIAAYRDVPPDGPRYEAAVRATMRCYEHWLAELAAVGQETGQQARDAAAYFRAQIAHVGAAQLPEHVDQLMRLADHAAGQQRRALTALAVQAAELAADGGVQLEGKKAHQFETSRAAALAAAGQYLEARNAYEALERTYPDDRYIREAHARLLGQAQDPKQLDQALAKWQQLQRMSGPGTAGWFRARYGQALAYARKGEKHKAVKLIKITQAVRPELGGPEMRDRFLELLSQCE